MAATDLGTLPAGLRQVALRPDLVDGAQALVAEAGWNQVPDDWALMLRTGAAIGLLRDDGFLAATALALPYPERAAGAPPFGWISMVLVAAEMRRQGLATRLLQDRIAWLQARGMVPILDATEAGEQVYAPLGFGPGLRISRWQGHGGPPQAEGAAVRRAGPGDRGAMAALDRAVFGADRTALVEAFLARPGSAGFLAGDGSGFGIVRAGRRAAQVGPLVARDESQAVALLDAALAAADGPVFLDVLDARRGLVAHLEGRGFTRQRGYLRMSLGQMPDFDGDGRSMVIAGPEYG